jgi:LEA14-like dessication related protein
MSVRSRSRFCSRVRVVRNNAPVPIPVSRVAFTFVMNGIVIGGGITEDPAVLIPGQNTPIPMELTVTNSRLIEWWPTHIHNEELTQYRVDVDAVLEVDLPAVGRQRFDIPLVNYQDEFRTNIMAD